MSCFDIKILNPDINTLEIATCVGDNDDAKIDIATSDNISTLEISTCVATLPEVSGLIPVKDILAGSGISVINATGIYTISLLDTNLTISDISDFLEGVQDIIGNSGLYAGNYINLNYNDTTGFTTVSVTGVQPSGNYSLVGHTHQASDITNFNSAVSGLIPPSNFTSLTGISGIIVINSGTDYIVKLDDPTIQLIDITDLSSNARTFLLTPSSYNLLTLVNDETGSGSLVFNNSPNFSGTPTVPTATSGTNTNQIASTAFVRTEINNLIDYAPATLDTLNELAAALGDDANFASTVTNSLASKAAISGVIFTGSVTIPSGTGNFNNLTVNGIGVSLSGHSHNTNDISNFSSGVSGLLPSVSGSGYISSNFTNNSYIISVSGLQPSGDYSLVGHTHTSSNISDFNSSVSGLLPNISGSGYVLSSFSNNLYTISVTGLQPSGNYSIVGHTHTSSDITDFNSSVSGLISVKNITAGSGINVSSTTGNYTISVSGLTSSYISDFNEAVDDRLGSGLLNAGTGVYLNYNDSSGILTIDNLHTEINVLSQEPQGFVNRNDSIISFDDSSRTFTIQPSISGGFYTIYVEGIKVIKNSIDTIVIGSGTSLNYIHFDTTPPYSLQTKTTGFDFDTDVPIAFIHWNSDINQSTFFGEERHGIRMDSVTHKWIHNTFGMQYISGLSIGGYILLGDGSSNSHAQIDISDGILYQEDIIINITNGTGSGEFIQQLSPIAYIPVYYHSGTTGQWVRDTATAFPLKYNATRAQYNLYNAGTWTTPNVGNNKYFAMWLVATNDINDPILAILGQREDSSLGSAENNNTWSSINLTNIPTQEIRPLYRLIFHTNNSYTNTPKSSLQSILDIRQSVQSTVAGVTQNDHGSLFGLADDDHSQYVHIDNSRTISAIHNLTNGIIFSGSGTQTVAYIPSGVNITGGNITGVSGNFTSLNVNGTGVSINGHSHTSSSITDFNSSVSGLLPSVTGTGYVNSSFNNNSYTISVSGLQPSGNYSTVGHTHTSSDITDFNSSVSGILPSVTGSTYISTSFSNNTYTINATGLQPLLTNPITGIGTSGYLSRFNSSNGLVNSNILQSGNNIDINGTLSISGVLIGEIIDDEVAGLLVAGSGIGLNYNDAANTLTINTSSNIINSSNLYLWANFK